MDWVSFFAFKGYGIFLKAIPNKRRDDEGGRYFCEKYRGHIAAARIVAAVLCEKNHPFIVPDLCDVA